MQTVAAIGYAAAGLAGGVLAALVAFAPSFAFVLLGARSIRPHPRRRQRRAFFAGAGPAAVGAILGRGRPARARPWRAVAIRSPRRRRRPADRPPARRRPHAARRRRGRHARRRRRWAAPGLTSAPARPGPGETAPLDAASLSASRLPEATARLPDAHSTRRRRDTATTHPISPSRARRAARAPGSAAARMNVWAAALVGGLGSSSLFLGQALAAPLAGRARRSGSGWGSAPARSSAPSATSSFPNSSIEHGAGGGIAFGLGAITYYVADRVVDRKGGADRQDLDAAAPIRARPGRCSSARCSTASPESFVLGITLALGGSIDVAFLAAVFVSNIPQGLAGTAQPPRSRGVRAGGCSGAWTMPHRRLRQRWPRPGFVARRQRPRPGADAEAFAGGAC